MAHITSSAAPAASWNPFAGLGTAILDALVAIAENNSRMREVERLQAMSDDALAKRGLKREDIVSHVYRELLYI